MGKVQLNYNILKKMRQWRHDSVAFSRECLHVDPSDQQIKLLEAVSSPEKRFTVRSGHGCGKDAVSTWIALWFIGTRPYAKVAVTAPTNRQLHDIFWAELAKWFRGSELQDEFVQQKDKFFHKSAPKEWWIRLMSPQVKATKEDQAETLAGLHADHLLLIIDEASGVADPVFIPLEGAMTQEDNKCILIGNMTKNRGYFYDSHFNSKIAKSWKRFHWDSRNSSLVADSMVEYFANKYGVESSVFEVRVAGNPPHEDERTLIPLAWARQCLGNPVEVSEEEPTYLGVDVARYGEDYSVILPRRGLIISPWDKFNGMNTISLAGQVNLTYEEMDASGVVVDEIGVGAGVTDWLYKHGHLNVFGLNVANVSSDVAKYHRLRDELWWRVREKCMKGVYSFPETDQGEELCDELSMPSYDFNSHGGVVIESKRAMKTRGVASPNIADALCNTEYISVYAHRVLNRDKSKKKRSIYSLGYTGRGSYAVV